MKNFCVGLFILVLTLFSPLMVVSGEAFACEEKTLKFTHNDKTWEFSSDELIKNVSREKQKLMDNYNLLEAVQKIERLGFDTKTALLYYFDNLDAVLEQIAGEVNLSVVDSEIVFDDSGLYATKEREGRVVVKDELYKDVWESITNGSNDEIVVKTDAILPDIIQDENALFINKRGEFTTYINGSNQEGRIHNIKTALSRFNKRRIEPNEVVSFNEVVGDTTEKNGYQKAKVILNGKYVDDFGGGVCQAATTLYNALLLAGIEVQEVNPHSLKVGYVAGAFDAMVSCGISDLVFKNTTNGPLFVATYCTDYECGATIFGAENLYEIKRKSRKVDFDQEKYPNVSSKYEGFLEYYQNGELVKNEKIRTASYFVPKVEKAES